MKGNNPLFDNQPAKIKSSDGRSSIFGFSGGGQASTLPKVVPEKLEVLNSLPFYKAETIANEILRQTNRRVGKRLLDTKLIDLLRD